MRSLPFLLPCLLLVACNNGPVEPGDAAYLGGRSPDDYQLRITGACPAGQFAKSVGADGTISCALPDMSAADIVGVTTAMGSGLVGGAAMGEVSLALAVCPAGQILKNDGTGWACAADADLLASKTCTMGQVLRFDGTTWSCGADADLLASKTCAANQVLRFDGTTWACAADADLLASKTCAANQVLRFDGTQWSCAADADLLSSKICALNQVLRFDGTTWSCAADADSFALRACPTGQVLKSNGSGWICAPDDDAPLPTCSQGQVLKSSGAGWQCANDDTQSSIPCPSGQILKSNGAGYVCAPDDGLLTITTAAGSGLVGGGSTGTLSLAIAPCADGQVLKAIDGGWTCGADDGLLTVTPALNGGLTGSASALSLTGCAAGEVLKSSGTGWACAADTVGLTAVTPLATGGLVGGATSLALAPCAAGEVLKSTSTGAWVCSADQNAGGDVTAIVTPATGGLTGGTASGDATLRLATCAAGQVLKSDGTGWSCAPDTGLTAVTPRPNGGIVGGATSLALAPCAAGEVLKSTSTGDWTCAADTVGLTAVTPRTNGGLVGGATTLALAPCAANEILKSTSTGDWVCAADQNAGGDITGVLTTANGGIVGGSASGDATLSLMNCPAGQLLKSTGTNTWSCQLDNDSGDITAVNTPTGGGLIGGTTNGTANLQLRTCAAGEVLKYQTLNGWVCSSDLNTGTITSIVAPANSGLTVGVNAGVATTTLTNCPVGQVLKSTGTNTWSCQADANSGDITGIITATGSGLAGGATSGDSTLTLTPCTLDQVLRFDGTGWSCSAYTAPYSAGAGILIASGAISANFTTPGSEAGTGTTVARGDHLHDTRYQQLLTHTVIVRSGGTAAQNGAALLAAIAGITSPSSTNRWLIKLEPGEYDLGTAGFVGKSWVDVEGSGRNVTLVTGTPNGAVMNMPAVSEVRELTVYHPGGTANAYGIQLSAGAAGGVVARRVTVAASNGTSLTYGVYVPSAGVARVEDSQIQIDASAGFAGGMLAQGGTDPIIRRTLIAVTGGATSGSFGVYTRGNTLILENVKMTFNTTAGIGGLWTDPAAAPVITASSLEMSSAGALVNSSVIAMLSGSLTLRDATIRASGNGVIALRTDNADVSLRNVELGTLDAPALRVGHGPLGVTKKLTVENSVFVSNTAPAVSFEAVPSGGAGVENVFLSSTRIDSTFAPALGASPGSVLKCWASYNENFDGLNAACN